MMLHEETIRFSNASIVARFTEWHIPASSAWMIKYFLPSAERTPRSAAEGPDVESRISPRTSAIVILAGRMGVSSQGNAVWPAGTDSPSLSQDELRSRGMQARFTGRFAPAVVF